MLPLMLPRRITITTFMRPRTTTIMLPEVLRPPRSHLLSLLQRFMMYNLYLIKLQHILATI
jgi:hypothetical protein